MEIRGSSLNKDFWTVFFFFSFFPIVHSIQKFLCLVWFSVMGPAMQSRNRGCRAW